MILELLASLVISTNFKEANVSLVHHSNHSFTLGDSLAVREAREKADRDQMERSNQEVIAREKITRASRGESDESIPYFYGFCTWYVAKEKGITESYGNARNWPVNSSVPAVGAVIVTYESRLGHVGIVKAVEGVQITIQEMNYAGWNRVSQRTVDYRTLPLKGFLI